MDKYYKKEYERLTRANVANIFSIYLYFQYANIYSNFTCPGSLLELGIKIT
jgi:hypothetical protein